jgi:hypothetical protein
MASPLVIYWTIGTTGRSRGNSFPPRTIPATSNSVSQGANPFWSAISISHLQNGFHGVQYFSGGTWVEAKTNGNLGQTYVVFPTTSGGSSYEIRVRDASDQPINNGRIYLFSFPTTCGQRCDPSYTSITYTVQ